MPSVEMRRSTRVFVPKTSDGEFVRVLRSGRRLWVETTEFKQKNGGEWCPLIESRTKLKPSPPLLQKNVCPESKAVEMEIDEEKPAIQTHYRSVGGNRMFVNVYSRKRKRLEGKKSRVSFDSADLNKKIDRKFGLHFVRRQRRKLKTFNDTKLAVRQEKENHGFLSIVANSSVDRSCIFSRLLCSLLRYMSREVIGLVELSMLLSTSISPVFASRGIRFLWDQLCIQRTGICRIYETRQFTPLFTVDFSALFFCFLHLHATMFIRSVRLSCLCSLDFHREDENTDIDEPLAYINDQSDHSLRRSMGHDKDGFKAMKTVRTSSGAGKLGIRNMQHRIGMTTRSKSKRRCRSLRTRKARHPLPFVLQKASGSATSDRVAVKKNPSPLAVLHTQELRSSPRKSSSCESSVPKTSSLTVNVDAGSQCCIANLLVVESDKGYRVEGAEIMLDVSASNEWFLSVKKDGSARFSLKVQTEMRPCTTNRFTHAVIWAAENGWKVEFSERKEWAIFKELYKLCWERNAVPASPVVKIIPVPGVREVISSQDFTDAPFMRPDSYIRMTSDELSKTLSSRTANYDMDSEDEKWLSDLNNGLTAADPVSEESFEWMVDALEKASYYRQNDCDDEESAADLCHDLASSLVAGEVYRHWLKKRKHKRAPLIRVFQLNQARRSQVITKPVLRKKRSLKRSITPSIQRGRGKDSSILQAMAAEQVEERCSTLIEEEDAKALANRLIEVAIGKRQRAQYLMENADLAVYRATMALRIADAAQVDESERAAAHFLE